MTVAVATAATRAATTARVAAVKEAPREASVEEVVEEVVRAAARVVTFTSTGARATRSARAARLVAGAVWRHSWSRQPRATLQPRAAHAGAREGGSQQSAEACAWCSRLPSLLLLRVGGVDSACTLPSIATAVSWGPGHGAAATKGARSIRILVKSRPFHFSAWHGHAQRVSARAARHVAGAVW